MARRIGIFERQTGGRSLVNTRPRKMEDSEMRSKYSCGELSKEKRRRGGCALVMEASEKCG